MKYFTVKEAAEQLSYLMELYINLLETENYMQNGFQKEMRIAEEDIIKFKENDISRTHYPISIASQN